MGKAARGVNPSTRCRAVCLVGALVVGLRRRTPHIPSDLLLWIPGSLNIKEPLSGVFTALDLIRVTNLGRTCGVGVNGSDPAQCVRQKALIAAANTTKQIGNRTVNDPIQLPNLIHRITETARAKSDGQWLHIRKQKSEPRFRVTYQS